MKPILVLCLGNEILSDDGFGHRICSLLERKGAGNDSVEIIFAARAGFDLLDLIEKREKVLIIDTIVTGRAQPGTVHFFPMGHLTPSNRLVASHQISLPTALKLGKMLGLKMPQDIDVLAVEAQDIYTFSEHLTAAVEASIEDAMDYIDGWLILREHEMAMARPEVKKSASAAKQMESLFGAIRPQLEA